MAEFSATSVFLVVIIYEISDALFVKYIKEHADVVPPTTFFHLQSVLCFRLYSSKHTILFPPPFEYIIPTAK